MTFPWYPDWFQWNPQTQEGRTFDHVVMRSNGRPHTVKGRDPMPWSTSKSNKRPHIEFSLDGKEIALGKHQLIWMAHHNQPIPDGCVIHHIDFNKDNNDPSNLQLMTEEEHMKIHGLNKKAIIALDVNGNVVHRFESISEAGKHGFSIGHISQCINGKRKTHRGLRWMREADWLALQK